MSNIKLSIVIVVVLLSGCASLSKEECVQGDWRSIGYRDGSRGASLGLLQEHRNACAKHKVAIDENAYRQARERGLREVYCVPRNAHRLGASGASYANVCPANMHAAFLEAYRYGQQTHQLRTRVRQTQGSITNMQSQLQSLDNEINGINQILTNYPRRGLRARLEFHLNKEKRQFTERMDYTLDRLEDQFRGRRRAMTLLDDFSQSSLKKGRLQNRLNWLKTIVEPNVNEQRKIQRLVSRLRREEERLQKTRVALLNRLPGDNQQRLLHRLHRVSVYVGVLESQQKSLRRSRHRDEVRDLIRFHYNQEPERVRERSDRRLLQDVDLKSRRQLRQDLDQAHSQRNTLEQQLAESEDQLRQLQADLQRHTQDNPYR